MDPMLSSAVISTVTLVMVPRLNAQKSDISSQPTPARIADVNNTTKR